MNEGQLKSFKKYVIEKIYEKKNTIYFEKELENFYNDRRFKYFYDYNLVKEEYETNNNFSEYNTPNKALIYIKKFKNISYIKKIFELLMNNIDKKNFFYYWKIFEFRDLYYSELQINQILDLLKNPKIEFRYLSFRYLNYLKKKNITEIKEKSSKEAVLIEFRNFHHIEFTLRNTIIKLGSDWSYTIVCGNLNYELVNNIRNNISQKIKIVKIDEDNLDTNKYSELFSKKDFWNNFEGEKILIFQEDSFIFKNNIDDFIEWDYIGAPWPLTQNDNFNLVGNGGLSLRTKSVMLKVIETININNTIYNSSTLEYMKNANLVVPPEDVYFSKNIIDYNLGKVADYETAKKFSVESIFYDNPLGGHNFWLCNDKWKESVLNNL